MGLKKALDLILVLAVTKEIMPMVERKGMGECADSGQGYIKKRL